jgi:hypothetical protein
MTWLEQIAQNAPAVVATGAFNAQNPIALNYLE